MMFCYLKTYKFFLILFFVDLIKIENQVKTFSLINKNNKFDEIKSYFISNVEKNKLATYMKRNKIKVKN
jgi:hypothetical protein